MENDVLKAPRLKPEDLYRIRQTVNFSFASKNSLSHENEKALSPFYHKNNF